MNTKLFLMAGLVLSILIILYLVDKLCRIYKQISSIQDVLEDIKSGNLNRRILVQEKDITKQICYDINQITANSQAQLIQQKQSELAYKRFMTSLSHDVKTPLASLVGYLEAVEKQMVTGQEKEEYVHVAFEKSQHLKQFIENLFVWVKLDSREQIFHFEISDLNELSRNIIGDWIPVLENSGIVYEIDIPEEEFLMQIDRNAYTRILNNLLQNILVHSGSDEMTLKVLKEQNRFKVIVSDNGKGISGEHLPHIFERLYQCDDSRSAKGNGLGLAIARELVHAHKGRITVNSIPGAGTEFILSFPRDCCT